MGRTTCQGKPSGDEKNAEGKVKVIWEYSPACTDPSHLKNTITPKIPSLAESIYVDNEKRHLIIA
jgi:hypothetical protein